MTARALFLRDHWWWMTFCVFAVSTAGARAAEGEIAIKQAPPEIVHRTFDPNHRPAEMPVLVPPEIGVCVSTFACEVRLWTAGPAGHPAETVVDSAEITTHLQITIWTREAAPDREREHEEGHRAISEYYYAEAATIARRLAETVVGQRLLELVDTTVVKHPPGTAPVTVAADTVRDRVVEAYLEKTHWRAAFAQQIFDDLTDHGRNDVAVSSAVTEAIAEEQGNAARENDTSPEARRNPSGGD